MSESSLCHEDCVLEELRSGDVFQVLRTLDVVSERFQVVKVLSRGLLDDAVILNDVKWLQRRKLREARCAVFRREFSTPYNWYLVFDCPGMTLKDVLGRQEMLPLPSRYVRAVMHQLVTVVCGLHRRGMLHLDICPATIEFIDSATVMLSEYGADGRFFDKLVLKCSRIRLVFYGAAGVRTDKCLGTDQYRAPELVFGWASKFRTDAFSIGCVFSEMLTSRPLFPPCFDEENYIVAKAHLFEAVLGAFPVEVVHRVSLMHEGLFDSSNELRGLYELTAELRASIANIKSLQELIEDHYELEVLEALTRISSWDRPHLSRVLCFTYFSQIR